LDKALQKRLGALGSNTIAGLLLQMAGMRTRSIAGVRPVNPRHSRFVGPAFTVRFVPVREDLTAHGSFANPGNPHHGTYDRVPAGSVVVFDMMGETRCGALGDVLVTLLKTRGAAGIVMDGGVRDGEEIADIAIPVFSASIAPPPSGTWLYGAGVQETIGCGGVMVVPGDIVVGDADGVVVIPRHLAEAVADKGEGKGAVEAWVRARIERGEPGAGLYPPTEAVVAEFHRQQKPKKSAAKKKTS
jgi:regulator of RNase E activity RraA